MVLRVAVRQLGQPAAAASIQSRSTFLKHASRPAVQYRSKWTDRVSKWWNQGSGGVQNAPGVDLENPKTRREVAAREKAQKAKANASNLQGSIFSEDVDKALPEDQTETSASAMTVYRTDANSALVLNPNPRADALWKRKKVIQMVRKNGKLTREERIKMTEREHTQLSEFMPTSLKKLVMLSRQIAGKPVDEAITQMHWSKKKMAKEVKYYLELARDTAIAQRGMGLGRVNGELLDKPVKIKTKEGKWREISDPTQMYVAQSWIGRGPWIGKEIDYKGRGRHGLIQHPSTSISIVLKEEKTRIREYEEKQAKIRAKGPWVHLPNRKVNHQRPYYSW